MKFTTLAVGIHRTSCRVNQGAFQYTLPSIHLYNTYCNHPAGSAVNSDYFWAYHLIMIGFYNGGLWEKIFWYTNIFDTKIILHNYILYYGELSSIGNFTVDLGMPMVITDFQ